MVYKKWTKKLSVGIPKIDEQHKKWFELMIQTHKSINTKDIKQLNLIVNDLLEFVRVHFSTEEDYFRKYTYPNADEHMVEHEKILLKSLQLKTKSEKRGESIIGDLTSLLDYWLYNHILVHDMKYAQYFKEIGVKK